MKKNANKIRSRCRTRLGSSLRALFHCCPHKKPSRSLLEAINSLQTGVSRVWRIQIIEQAMETVDSCSTRDEFRFALDLTILYLNESPNGMEAENPGTTNAMWLLSDLSNCLDQLDWGVTPEPFQPNKLAHRPPEVGFPWALKLCAAAGCEALIKRGELHRAAARQIAAHINKRRLLKNAVDGNTVLNWRKRFKKHPEFRSEILCSYEVPAARSIADIRRIIFRKLDDRAKQQVRNRVVYTHMPPALSERGF